MKKIVAVLFCIITMVLYTPEVSAAEKYLTGKGENYQIVLNQNGNAHIKEERSYFFGGDTITRCQRRYYLNGYSLENFTVLFDDKPMKILDEPDENRPKGCAAVYRQNGECYVDLYINCLNEEHRFTIEYDVINAVVLHDETSEFKWAVSSNDEPSDTPVISASVIVPTPSEKDIKIKNSGFNKKFKHNKNDDFTVELVFDKKNLDKDEKAVINLIMPKELFPNAKRYECTDFDDSFSNVVTGLSIFFFIISCIPVALLLFVILFFISRTTFTPKRFSQLRFTPSQVPDIYPHIPDELPPAIVSKLFTTYVNYENDECASSVIQKNNSFFITLADLAERGVVLLRKDDADVMISLSDYSVQTYDFEEPVIEFTKNAIGKRNEISLMELEEYFASSIAKEYGNFRKFNKLVKQNYRNSGFVTIHKPKSFITIKFFAFASLSVIFSFIIHNSTITYNNILFTILTGISISALTILTASLYLKLFIHNYKILTQEGEDRLALWKAFGRYIDNPDQIDILQPVSPADLKRYVVYSMALGRDLNYSAWCKAGNNICKESDDFTLFLLFCNSIDSIASGSYYTFGNSCDSDGFSFDSGGSSGGGGGGGCSSGSSGGSFD